MTTQFLPQKVLHLHKELENKPKYDVALLQEYLRYEPETGNFYWLKDVGGHSKGAGSLAGWTTKLGYRKIILKGKGYEGQVLAWLLSGRELPPTMYLDHKDRNPSNNKLNNLRLVTARENQYNAAGWVNTSTGIKGLVKQGNKLIARVSFNGTRYSKNFKPTQIEQAKEWLVNTRNQLHGEFAHHGL